MQRVRVNADEVLREVLTLARADIGDILDFTGDELKMRPANTIRKHARRCISSYKVKRERIRGTNPPREVETVEFRLWNKPDSLEQLMKHCGLLKDLPELELLLARLPGPVVDRLRQGIADLLRNASTPASSGNGQH
jgi:hypothetical protein